MNENDYLEMWKYFSGRADASANGLRGILFLSANAGIITLFSSSAHLRNLEDKVPIFVVGVTAFIFFGVANALLISSWSLQKKKSITRRRAIAYRSNGNLKDLDDLLMSARIRRKIDYTILNKENAKTDGQAVCLLVAGYLALALSAGLLVFLK